MRSLLDYSLGISVLLFGVSIVIYFIPYLIAAHREHHNTFAIFILDLLLGWTLIGWVFALVWACTQVYPRGAMHAELPPRWSIEHDEEQWSAQARGERQPSRW